jgi:transposase
MTNILDLKGWVVLSKTQSDGEYVIEAEYTVQPTNCPKCGVVDTSYKHDVKHIKYRDGPIRGVATVILAQVQRYRCAPCKERFHTEKTKHDESPSTP